MTGIISEKPICLWKSSIRKPERPFQAELIPVNGVSRLRLRFHCDPARFPDTAAGVRRAVSRLQVVRDAASEGLLDIDPIRLSLEKWVTTGAAKRTLIDRRQQGPLP